ncbi:hypothetical protein AB1Y20_005775 [Prymnesium parvum]|uniref:HTH cro/C1-type domain-containing protein n=1 Tax=Prymnesium parvum TaxID=97485 RepID=A0AB34J0D0_PRYPA
MPSRSEYKGQDWNEVTFTNKPPAARPGSAQPGSGNATSAQRAHGSANSMTAGTGLSARKLEDETEELKHQTVSTDLKLAIIKARNAKGLTQKQLAQQLNMQPQVINEYESGKAIPNNAIIAKIERALGAKLPRAKK